MRGFWTKWVGGSALSLVLLIAVAACESDGGVTGGGGADAPYLGRHVHTLRMGASDNVEQVTAVPGQPRALVVKSKARKVSLVDVATGEIRVLREAVFFGNDPSESEVTHADVSPDGTWAAAVRTIIEVDGSGAQTACGGELFFFDATDSETFGTIFAVVPVGPMPDNVAISGDGRFVVTADERDGPDAWGKCLVPGATASITVVDTSAGPTAPTVMHRIEVADTPTAPREPESVAISRDNNLVVVTLQDSHEVAFFRVSALEGNPAPTADDLLIVRLPDDPLGAPPWPDGVTAFVAGDGEEYFVTAGEWNDTFTILSGEGEIVSNTVIAANELPANLPRVLREGYPPFSPDTIATFTRAGRVYLALTLRHSGAVVVYDATDPAAPFYRTTIAVGADERGGQDRTGSTIRPEGICAAPDGSFILVANEEESSVSLIVPEG